MQLIVVLMALRILSRKKHRQIVLQCFWKVWKWPLGWFVHHINSFYEVLKLKQNFQKNKVVAKIPSFWCVHFVLTVLFVITLASDISALYGNEFFGKGFLFPENLFQNEGIGNVEKFHWSSHKNMSSQTEGYFENP